MAELQHPNLDEVSEETLQMPEALTPNYPNKNINMNIAPKVEKLSKRSPAPIWSWFTRDIKEHNKAKCSQCEESISCINSGTTAMINHMKRQHPDVFKDVHSLSKVKLPIARRTTKRKKAPVWDWFEEVSGDFKATCSVCSSTVSCANMGTSSMINHIKRHHLDIYVRYLQDNLEFKRIKKNNNSCNNENVDNSLHDSLVLQDILGEKINKEKYFDEIWKPSNWIDVQFTGKKYSSDNLSVYPFMAGSLREIVLSIDFEQMPKTIQRKIMHLSFLMHAVCKYDDYDALYKHHCEILKDINADVTTWSDDAYFDDQEDKMLDNLQAGDASLSDLDKVCKVEFKPKLEENLGNLEHLQLDADEQESSDDFNGCDNEQDDVNSEPDLNLPDLRSETENIPTNQTTSTTNIFCELCDDTILLDDDDSLRKHNNRVHKEKVVCPHCGLTLYSEKLMVKHVQNKHGEEMVISLLCSTCGTVSENHQEHIQHVRSHRLEKCDQCNKSFQDAQNLKSHIRYAHSEEREMCPHCGKYYKRLQQHILTNHTNNKKMCTKCDFVSAHQCIINKHYRTIHESEGRKCEHCGKLIKDMKRHLIRGCIVSEGAKFEKKFTCQECGKQLRTKHKLKAHVDSVHLRIKDKVCTQCDYRTSSKFNLKIHITRVHEGKMLKSNCPYCQKQVFGLDWHLQTYHQKEINMSLQNILSPYVSATDVPIS